MSRIETNSSIQRLGRACLMLCILVLLAVSNCQASVDCGYGVGPQPNANPGDGAPPYVPGTTSYNCSPGGGYDQMSSFNSEPNMPYIHQPQLYAYENFKVTSAIQAEVKTICHIDIALDITVQENEYMAQYDYAQAAYKNHYICAGSGKKWLWQSKLRCEQKGTGEVFSPTAWICAIQGYPPAGAPVWEPAPQCSPLSY